MSDSAETAFAAAFERLKAGRPVHLHKGTRVTQNNVAREAGRDPSALKKARYPDLVHEIQEWTRAHQDANLRRSGDTAPRKQIEALKERVSEITRQRDAVASLLVEADAKILELTLENQRLRALSGPTSISPLRR